MFSSLHKGISRLTAALTVVIATGSPAFAQIFPPPPATGPLIPLVPVVQPTPGGTLLGNNNTAQTITVRWFESNTISTQRPAPATHFVVCVQAPALPCAWPTGSPLGVFAGAATGSIFTRIPAYSGSPFGGLRIIIGYNYSADIVLDNRFNDRPLKWSVAACSGMVTANCASAVAGSAWFTTKELVANANIAYYAPNIVITAQGANIGTTRAENFQTRVLAYGALVGRSGGCAVDPNEPGLGPFFNIITRDGGLHTKHDFWNGTRYDVSGVEVVAILNDANYFTATSLDGLDPQGPIPNGNPPAVSPILAHTFLASALPPTTPGVTTQFGVVVITTLDETLKIKEVNESDNQWAECSTFFR